MKKQIRLFNFILLLIVFMSFFTCTKEAEINNYSKYPIDLKVEQLPNGGIKYSWNAINTSDFKEYWIVRNSVDSVPYLSKNDPVFLSNLQNIVIAKITDATQTEIIDTVTLLGGKTFVRIFAFLENRSLSSLNKEVKGFDNLIEVNKNIDNIILDKRNNLFCALDGKSNLISSLDPYIFSTIKTFSSPLDLSKEIYLDESTNITQLYVPVFDASYSVFNLSNLNFLSGDNFVIPTLSMLVCRNSFIVAAGTKNDLRSKNKSNSFFLPFPNFVLLKSLNKLNISPLLRWNSINNEVLALTVSDSTSILNVVSLASDGALSLKSNLPLKLKSKSALTTNFMLTPNNSFILLDEQGIIIETNTLEIKGTLAAKVKLNNVRYLGFTFSTDEKFVYALRDGNVSTEKKIDVFDYPTFDYVKSMSYKSKPKKIFFHDNMLKLIGESPNNVNFTMIEIIKP
jgi:hypothetical protein